MSRKFPLWGLALLMLLPAAWLRAPSRQQELRVLITARNMVRAGNPLHFEFQNQPRYRKPPLPYWLSGLGQKLGGRHASAFWGRLPFAGITLALLLLLRRMAGPSAALLTLCSYGIWRYGVSAETDMLNVFGICLAFRGHGTKRGITSGLGMGIAVLSKGPAGLFIPLISFAILQRNDARPLRYWVSAISIPLVCAAAWIAFLLLDPVAKAALQVELSDTFLNSPHRKIPFYYLWVAPLILFPGSLLPGRFRRGIPLPRLPLVWFGVTFVLLTLTVSKQNHYALLLLPPGAWLLAGLLPASFRLEKTALFLVILSLIGEGARYRLDEHAAHLRFLREAAPRVAHADTLHVVGVNSAIFDFHLGRHVHNTDSLRRAYHRATPEDAVLVIQKRGQTEELPAAEPALDQSDQTWIRALYLRD